MPNILSEQIPELGINKKLGSGPGIKTRQAHINTPDEWGVAELIVRAFESYYKDKMKRVWGPYIKNRREASDQDALAMEGELRQAGFRQSLTFPIFHDAVFNRDDSLQQKLEMHCPEIFKNQRKLRKFQKLYPEFVVATRI